MQVSILVSTYNWPEALNLCLSSILIQSKLPYEVVVADDGSTEETAQLVKQYAEKAPFPVKHVWHEDNGFRAGAIRNKAIAACESEYIVQVDGDMILHPEFIKDHCNNAKKGFFVRGSRVMLNGELSRKIVLSGQVKFSFWESGFKAKRFNALRPPFIGRLIAFLYDKDSYKHVKGCNMAFWKQDAIKVNGYNEEIYEWGREDNEIAARLINAGIYKRSIKWSMVSYHIEHRFNSRERLPINSIALEETVNAKKVWCKKGLDQYL